MVREISRLNESTIALVKLSRKKMIDIASESEIIRTNITNALAGDRGLPDDKVERLQAAVGMVASRLDTNHIHYWRVGYDLKYFRTAIKSFFPEGAIIAGLWTKGISFFDLQRAAEGLNYIVYDNQTMVVVQRSNLGTFTIGAKPITPETVEALRWHGGEIGADTMITLPKEIMKSIKAAHYQEQDYLRQLIGAEINVGWDQVIDLLRSKYKQPAQAFEAVKTWLNL